MSSDNKNDFNEIAIERMKQHGLRITQPRIQVVEALAETDQPLSAYRIKDHIEAQGQKADVVSIYRTLTTLDSLGLVHFVHSSDGFLPCTLHNHEGPGIEHAVCDDCGKVIELDLSKQTTEEISGQLQQIGFQLRHVRVEIEGQCGDCTHKNAPGP